MSPASISSPINVSKIRINDRQNKNYLSRSNYRDNTVIVHQEDAGWRISDQCDAVGRESFIWLTVWFLGLVTLIFLSIFLACYL